MIDHNMEGWDSVISLALILSLTNVWNNLYLHATYSPSLPQSLSRHCEPASLAEGRPNLTLSFSQLHGLREFSELFY